ncbi:MAG: hypothetical protein PUI10_01480 [Prevotellaceae bacterium]|nr:hypothetical protein [Prevotellaceae bacterium]MDY3295348.1 hypothetical protein [Bacteroidaceae bacterium]
MRNKLYLALTAVAAGLALTSCSKMGALSSDNFSVTPNPLETVGDQVPATINGRFPEKYMKKKATVKVTPVLKYSAGETASTPANFQGEKVVGNDQTIAYRVGGNYTMKANYQYAPEMLKSELYLQFEAKKGKKTYNVPEVKVADGIIATSTLVNQTIKSTVPAYAADAYQHIIKQKEEANIKFLIQQAKIRTSELKSVSVQKFIETLQEIKKDQKRKALDNIEVSAYASPDGGLNLNTKLAKNREDNTAAYVKKTMKNTGIEGNLNTKYTAEDWEGFQKLVAESNIQDKEVILRVLNMYQDPEEREAQIRNISAAFTELAKVILPELRRARISLNYDLIGRSDNEIMQQFKADAKELSIEELLYAATLTDKAAEKKEIFKKTTELYPNDYRAFNNLAVIAIQEGNYDAAQKNVEKALKINANAAEANVNAGLIALINNNKETAKNYLAKGSANEVANNVLGNLYLKEGNYAQAVKAFGNTKSNSAGLAQLLTKDYMTAASTLSSVTDADALTYYLKAVIAARTNNSSLAVENLKSAIKKDSSLAKYAANDLEFKKLAEDAAFKALTK